VDPAWTSSLRDLLGTSLSDVCPEDIQSLADQQLREVAELDFKSELYGNGESDRRELAADIASMRNDRGGVIVLGVED
jgi:hypothetical protein